MAKIIVWALVLLGSAVGMVGAVLFWIQQAQISGETIWPLPALVLILWALLAVASMVASVLAVQTNSFQWVEAAWALDGRLLPMAILGGFSIGPLV